MDNLLRPVGDRWALRFERRIPHPPEKVWRAITEPSHLSQWYPMTAEELDLNVGGAILFRDEEGTAVRAEITELDPPKTFAFREYEETTGVHDLRLELAPDGEGCLLTFTHTFADKTWAAQTETGWLRTLDDLDRVLATIA
ncbi:SRPBCC domain-containing protein [Nonomuraea purpurea]|uniref:SRPBCC domain-containing protein n=1 Tax=Nonomuraea purpurea TaxID=1849276 RepID=A0ABV8G8B9_9ACTN